MTTSTILSALENIQDLAKLYDVGWDCEKMLRVLFKTKIICLKVLKAYFDIYVVTTVNPATKVNSTKNPATKVNSNKNKNKMLRVLFETQKIIT